MPNRQNLFSAVRVLTGVGQSGCPMGFLACWRRGQCQREVGTGRERVFDRSVRSWSLRSLQGRTVSFPSLKCLPGSTVSCCLAVSRHADAERGLDCTWYGPQRTESDEDRLSLKEITVPPEGPDPYFACREKISEMPTRGASVSFKFPEPENSKNVVFVLVRRRRLHRWTRPSAKMFGRQC